MRTAPRQNGFTLLELMVVISIAGVLLAAGVPALGDFIRGSRLSSAARGIVVDLSLARNEAVLRATSVTVCTSSNLSSCANASWNDGRLIFVDGGAIGTVDGGDVILSITQPLNNALTTAATDIAAPFFINYSPRGRLANWGQITVCAPDQMRARITVRRSGTATLDRTAIPC